MHWVIVLSVAAFFWFLFMSSTGYLHVIPWCRIKIQHDVLRGGQTFIKASIKQLKSRDRDAYQALCGYVDVIYERACVGADWHIYDPKILYDKPGCYVRGTRTIYLSPKQNFLKDEMAERAKELKRLAEHSKAFWEEK